MHVKHTLRAEGLDGWRSSHHMSFSQIWKAILKEEQKLTNGLYQKAFLALSLIYPT